MFQKDKKHKIPIPNVIAFPGKYDLFVTQVVTMCNEKITAVFIFLFFYFNLKK